jgi:transposase
MDRSSLEVLLGQGLSLAEIGRRFGRHEATVGYWVKKYGLTAPHKNRHASRGEISKDRLEPLVEAGLSIAQISDEIERSKATVRHWLTRYGLKTHGALGRRVRVDRRLAKEADLEILIARCQRHGETEFWLDKRGYYRCKQCRSQAVARRRRKMKRLLVQEAGGECAVCGYARNVRALHFHHVEPSLKRYEVNARGAAMALDRLRAEAAKCVLLCANCHAEAEAGMIRFTEHDGAYVQFDARSPPFPG